nr:hypothetical protein [uncultured Cellulosilyticum sp.]
METHTQANEKKRYRRAKERQVCSLQMNQQCGTLDTGCPQPAISYIDNSMCNGVFSPVCAPEVCNVPRMSHHETLIEGGGTILDRRSGTRMNFTVLIEREMQVYKGKIQLTSEINGITMVNVEALKYFEGDGEHYGVALFKEDGSTQSILFTLQHQHVDKGAQIYVYATDLQGAPINIEGEVIAGELKFYKDHNVHEH